MNRLGDEKLYEYYRNGRLSEVRDFNGNTTTFRYDEAARLSEKEFSGGDTETYTYDGQGNVLSAVNPSSELEYVYDPLGRLTKSTDHLKDQSISYSYDAAGNRTSLSWADGNRTTGWSYNELNLPVSMSDAEGEVTRFNYDPLGRETSRILPNGITRETTYDKAGRITSISHDEEWNNGHHHGYGRNSRRNGRLPSRLYAYNEAGQKILQVDELGRLTAWEYDNAGRLSEASYAFAGGKSVADFRERIYLGVIPEEIKKDQRNGHNRDEGWLNGRGSSRYEMGNLFGRNSVLQDLGFSEEDFSSGLEETYSELSDVFPDMKGFDYRAAARMKGHSFFERDRSGLSGRFPGEIRRWFNHGELNRLLRQPLWTEEFSYDRAGNITGKTNGWGEIAYTYNEENRLTKAGEREYTWDANGNMTGESLGMLSAYYSYDGENRLTGITSNHRGFLGSPGKPMDKGILYSYDSFGRRISREEITNLHGGRYRDRFASTGERVSYLYDGLGFDVLAEGRDAAGRSRRGGWHGNSGRVFNPTSEYLRTNGSVIVRNDITGSGRSFLDFFHGGSPSRSYYTQDGLGSVMGTFNKNGNLEERYAYDSFGRLTEGRFDGENRLGYNGKRMDPYSGRYDYGFRDYDPMAMRWTTVDPIRDGVNWYAYVGNDPVNLIDLWGLCAGETDVSRNGMVPDYFEIDAISAAAVYSNPKMIFKNKLDALGPYGDPRTRDSAIFSSPNSNWDVRAYRDRSVLAGLGETLRSGTYEGVAGGGGAVSFTGPLYGGSMGAGTVTLTTYASDNNNTLLGYDVRLTLPGNQTNPLSELNTVIYKPGKPLDEDHAREILEDHPNIVDQALGDDRRNLLQKIIDWLL